MTDFLYFGNNNNLKIEAWIHGPVVPVLYQRYKNYSGYDIPKNEYFDTSIFTSEVLDILEQVWDEYGKFTGNQLEAISHQEKPWIDARDGVPPYEASSSIISDKNIFMYYNEQAVNNG